jgi:hypothetical protein
MSQMFCRLFPDDRSRVVTVVRDSGMTLRDEAPADSRAILENASLFRSLTLLRRLGFQIDPTHLAGRAHRAAGELLDRRRAHRGPVSAARCGDARTRPQHGLHRAAVELSTGVCRCMDREARHGASARGLRRRPRSLQALLYYTARQDRSWEGNAVEFKSIVSRAT